MKYYIIAGERSGDLHAANLIKEFKKKDAEAIFRGFGGDALKKAGADIIVHYKELSVMGLWEVITSLSKIMRYLAICKKDIYQFQPDVLILIDYAGFNIRLAKFAHQNGLRVFYYISPKIWAWNQKRAWKIKSYVDQMFVILPFEEDFYARYDYKVNYVGNPVADAVYNYSPDKDLKQKLSLSPGKPVVALLPGSRKQELKNIFPVMCRVIEKFPDLQFVIAGIKDMDVSFYETALKNTNAQIIYEKTYDLLNIADAAIVTSGTATLETALWNVPQVVVYKTSKFNYAVGKRFVKVDFISLVNLIAGHEVVSELIQEKCTSANVASELKAILFNAERNNHIKSEYHRIKDLLGYESTSEKAAALMINYLKEPYIKSTSKVN